MQPLIYLITDGEMTAENFSEKSAETLHLIEKAVSQEISLIQIREKKLSAKLGFELALQAAKITKNSRTKLLINDRADIALAANTDGVHLTANSLSARIIRANFPRDFIIGVSTHSLEKAEIAKQQGADFATFSPIFPTVSKEKHGAPQGIGKLKEVVDNVKDFPIIALGGIDEDNFVNALRVGAKGIAGISLFSDSEKFAKVVKKINSFAFP